ncbi:MAG: hypothetical protein US49_C0001G0102 [candidate division TM6 bacterium GW2011_GWF2_37_49]|nr:MAG: hypothetical protein US49_C0001G0102 [candidate division TM6 bacterium GW2011_GWF2_37_49]
MKNYFSLFLKGTAFALVIALLPGCAVMDFFKKKEEKSEGEKSAGVEVTLCKINDKVVITKDDFDKRINQILQANPYFRGAGADMLPPQVKQNVFKRLVEEELLIHDSDVNKIESDAEFKKIYAEMKNLLKRSVKIQLTEKKIFDKIQIAEEELKAHFDQNKDRYVKVAGGVLVTGIKFDTDASASVFLATAKAKIANFEELAKKNKSGKFREFGRVAKEASGAAMGMEATPAPIKEAALSSQSLPFVQKVKVGKDVWIIKASDRKEPVYFELSEIAEQLSGMLKNNKFKDEYAKVVKELEGKYKISTNDEFFKTPAKPEGQVEGQVEPKEGDAPVESTTSADGADKEDEVPATPA